MTDLTLYSMPSSGNSYKARLLLAMLGRDYTHIGLEYETPELAAAHADGKLPLGKLPVLELADGTRLNADIVLIGIGILPNSELAEAAKLDCNGGILVDEDAAQVIGEFSLPEIAQYVPSSIMAAQGGSKAFTMPLSRVSLLPQLLQDASGRSWMFRGSGLTSMMRNYRLPG